jgi:hypothetical protein
MAGRTSALYLSTLSCLLLASAHPVGAQLISPGKLSSAHASVDGVRNCTECHALRQRGSSNARCLSCHAPIETRIATQAGYHATVREQNCGGCHKEHLGTAVQPTRFDTTTFRHTETGFELKGGHVRAGCRECHAPERITAADIHAVKSGPGYLRRTFLGVGTTCLNCHRTESPHGIQFSARSCADCHDERNWTSAPRFDHGKAAYALTGEHERVDCYGCHTGKEHPKSVRWAGVKFSACTDCHRDPHAGKMAGTCTKCHSTAGWRRIDATTVERGFDHSRTRFALRGAHARADCSSCHGARRERRDIAIRFVASTERFTYARPVVRDCASCHVDPHPARLRTLAGGLSCAACHTEQRWGPTTYDLPRHDRVRAFPLTGGHAVVTCQACHADPRSKSFILPASSCRSCHTKDDPHKGEYGARECAECHRATRFQDTFFDHAGAQGAACTTCHQRQDPHAGQFRNLTCDRCHATTTFRIERFDHRATRYPLDGEHMRVRCASCHRAERAADGRTFIRYKPLATTCAACHGGNR